LYLPGAIIIIVYRVVPDDDVGPAALLLQTINNLDAPRAPGGSGQSTPAKRGRFMVCSFMRFYCTACFSVPVLCSARGSSPQTPLLSIVSYFCYCYLYYTWL
jgi:hypothetical protein